MPRHSILIIAMVIFSGIVCAASPKWGGWERANTIAKHGQWAVIRQPDEGFCYLKQSYAGDTRAFELSMQKDGIPALISPFFRGLKGPLLYKIDNGPWQSIALPKNTGWPIPLPAKARAQMKAGNLLFLKAKATGVGPITQRVSLRGFSKSSSMLGGAECRKKAPDQADSYD